MHRKWSHETFSEGATYGVDDESPHRDDVLALLREEGLAAFENIDCGSSNSDDVYVIMGNASK